MEKVIFVRVQSKLKGFNIGKGGKYVFEDVQDIIKEKIKEGYTYQGYVPVEFRGTGDMSKIDLIFTKENK